MMKEIVNAQIEQDEHQHAEQLSLILNQGQADTARFRVQVVQEGEQSRAIIESTRAQAYTPLTEMASQRLNLHQTAIQPATALQQSKGTWTMSDTSCAFLRNKSVRER